MQTSMPMSLKISSFAVLALATIGRTFTSSESFCVQRNLSFHPNPPIKSHLCVNTTSPCKSLEPGIKYCKKGATGLWRLVRCNPGYELHVVKIKKSGSDYLKSDYSSSSEFHSSEPSSNETQQHGWMSETDVSVEIEGNETQKEVKRTGLNSIRNHLQLVRDMPIEDTTEVVEEGSEYYWGSCHDINECERGEEVHSCSHICQNLPGSFRCRCPVGFALAKDGRTCLSIAKNFASVVGMLFSQSVDYISDHQL